MLSADAVSFEPPDGGARPKKVRAGPRKRRPRKRAPQEPVVSSDLPPRPPHPQHPAQPWNPHPEEDARWTPAARGPAAPVPPSPRHWRPFDQPLGFGVEGPVDELEQARVERERWREWAIAAAELERARRLGVLRSMEEEEEEERLRRRHWAMRAIEEERQSRVTSSFLTSVVNTQWFSEMISGFCAEYEIVCPNSSLGCRHICMRGDLADHLTLCPFGAEDRVQSEDNPCDEAYEVMCPNAVLGCTFSGTRPILSTHLMTSCRYQGPSRGDEADERAQWRRRVIEAAEAERDRRIEEGGRDAVDNSLIHRLLEEQTCFLQGALHCEIEDFFNQQKEMRTLRRPAFSRALELARETVAELWPGAVVEPYGSYVTLLMGASSDLDLVVCGLESPLDPEKHVAMINELAEHLSNAALCPWVRSARAIHTTSVPVVKASATVGGMNVQLDLSFDAPNHRGIANAGLVKGLCDSLPSLAPIVLVLKEMLAIKGLNDAFTGGLSSYGLILACVHVLLRELRGTSSSSLHRAAPSPRRRTAAHPASSPTATATATAEKQGDGDDDCVSDNEARLLRDPVPLRKTGTAMQQREQGYAFALELVRSAAPRQHSGERPKAARALFVDAPPPPKLEAASSSSSSSSEVEAEAAKEEEEEEEEEKKEEPPRSLGKLFMDVLHVLGEDLLVGEEGISVRHGGFRFFLNGSPPHPHVADPIVIEDPFLVLNNVGRNCYRIASVQRAMAEALATMSSVLVRVGQGARLSDGSAILGHTLLEQIFAHVPAPVTPTRPVSIPRGTSPAPLLRSGSNSSGGSPGHGHGHGRRRSSSDPVAMSKTNGKGARRPRRRSRGKADAASPKAPPSPRSRRSRADSASLLQ